MGDLLITAVQIIACRLPHILLFSLTHKESKRNEKVITTVSLDYLVCAAV